MLHLAWCETSVVWNRLHAVFVHVTYSGFASCPRSNLKNRTRRDHPTKIRTDLFSVGLCLHSAIICHRTDLNTTGNRKVLYLHPVL